jgi:hypothetical protein
MSSRRIAVCLEVRPKLTFASALDWPGWGRAGRDEGAALEALDGYAERYAPVADRAGVSFPSTVRSWAAGHPLDDIEGHSPHPNAAARSLK